MSGKITITMESCSGCPMIWNCILPDGSDGYIRYRWGFIQLKPVDSTRAGIFVEPIIEEKIGDDLDGMLDLDSAVRWLEKQGYDVAKSSDYFIKEHY